MLGADRHMQGVGYCTVQVRGVWTLEEVVGRRLTTLTGIMSIGVYLALDLPPHHHTCDPLSSRLRAMHVGLGEYAVATLW